MICQTCRGQVTDGAESCPHCGRALVETKGVLSIVFWGIAGLVAGVVIAPLVMVVRNQHERIDGFFVLSAVTNGAVIGTIAGLCVGLFLWAFFPYKTRPEEQETEDSSEKVEEPDWDDSLRLLRLSLCLDKLQGARTQQSRFGPDCLIVGAGPAGGSGFRKNSIVFPKGSEWTRMKKSNLQRKELWLSLNSVTPWSKASRGAGSTRRSMRTDRGSMA
jgi:hypothetical protein